MVVSGLQIKVCADKTAVPNVIATGEINSAINQVPAFSFKMANIQGGLYNTYMDTANTTYWKDAQLQPIWVYDSYGTIWFHGRITNIVFGSNEVAVECRGITEQLGDRPIKANGILAQGVVKTVNYDGNTAKLRLEQADNDAFSWTDDQWIGKGIIIENQISGTSSVNWIATSKKSTVGVTNETNTYTNTQAKDTSYHTFTMPALMTNGDVYYNVGGTGFTGVLSSVKLYYRVRITKSATVNTSIKCYLKNTAGDKFIYKDIWNDVWFGGTKVLDGEFDLTGDPNLDDILNTSGSDYVSTVIGFELFNLGIAASTIDIDYIYLTLTYFDSTNVQIMKEITDSGSDWIICSGFDFTAANVSGESSGPAADGDAFKIGDKCSTILDDVIGFVNIPILNIPTSKYFFAQVINWQTAHQFLTQICNLEGWGWMEVPFSDPEDGSGIYVFDEFDDSENVANPDSGIDLDSGDYAWDFKFERKANQYGQVNVQGANNLHVSARDTSANASPLVWTHTDNMIQYTVEAQAVAQNLLTRYKVVRPSLELTLFGDGWTGLNPGYTVDVTLTNPTVTLTAQPIRRMTVSQSVTSQLLTIKLFIGTGETPQDEEMGMSLSKLASKIRQLEGAISQLTTGEGPIYFDHSDLANVQGSSDQFHVSSAEASSLTAFQPKSTKLLAYFDADGDALWTNDPIGMIGMWGGASAPTGWLLCDGSTYNRTTYAALFAVIGTTYGTTAGDNFKVPDFRGVSPYGLGASSPLNALANRDAGPTHLHTIGHGHAISNAASTGNTGNASPNTNTVNASRDTSFSGSDAAPGHNHTVDAHSHSLNSHTHANTVTDMSGNSGSTAGLSPYLVVNFIIKY